MFKGKFAFAGMVMAYDRTDASAMAEAHPVFCGLQEAMVSAREIAPMLGVAPSSARKWRRGRVKMSDTKFAFLTLFLANWLDEIEREKRSPIRPGRSAMGLRLEATRRALGLQEGRNASLPPGALSKIAGKICAWWDARADRRNGAASSWDFAPALAT